jgi:Protein of unknown function (DUF1592)/Protein of unknown function (DUF1588)/Protein of unknown function (DUF1585)/Protein of unknown function (DUF1587)/Protein of unknown function (DUF1595)
MPQELSVRSNPQHLRLPLAKSAAVPCLVVFSGLAFGAAPVSRQPLLNQYCVPCHSQKLHTAGIVLENSAPESPADHPELWEKVVRKLEAGEMPPSGMPRPAPAVLKAFINGITCDLDEAARKSPYAGRPVIARLNRVEYANAIRDLLHIELPVAAELPPDGIAAGFDDIGDALSMSPLLLEQYLRVARKVSEATVGVGDPSPVTETFPAPDNQTSWLGRGFPLGTRGGVRVEYYFPFDGEYNLRAFIGRDSLPHAEGIRFFQKRVAVKAGSHIVVVTFPDEFAQREGPVPNVAGKGGPALGGPLDTRGSAIHPTIEFRVDSQRVTLFDIGGISVGEAAFGGQPGPPTLDRIEISGPYNATGISPTPSRERLFVCRPASRHDERACASKILFTVTHRAFRRDVTASDVQPFLTAWANARQKQGFDASIAVALRDVLLAPDFLFRLEFDPPNAPPNSPQKIPDFELASRLSFFIWNSIPDDELLRVAHLHKLRDSAVLTSEVRRMLADPRALTMVDNFAAQWLGLNTLDDIKPDPKVYAQYDSGLADDFREETRLFVRSLVRENRSVLDLISANYSYLDERLAQLYGVPGVIGPGFRRVSLASEPERNGLLGQGSILMLTSHTTKTSPILRGKWVLSALLNSPPPPPPAGVPPLDESPANGRKLTTREQVERHRKNAVCASCHSRMDPLGFSLENFDVIGRWRTRDDGGLIDPSGKLVDGQTFSGPQGLKQVLLSRQDQFVQATIARFMTYALGRELEPRDQPTIRHIMHIIQAGNYRFEDIIVAVVNSVPFRMRQTPDQAKEPS